MCILIHSVVMGLAWLKLITAIDLELISVLPYSAPVAPALKFTGAALDVAVEKANLRFGHIFNVSVTFLYGAKGQNCDQGTADAVPLLAEHYYREHDHPSCMAIIGTNCGGLLSVIPFSREWNILLFNNGFTALGDYNMGISPSALSLAGTTSQFSSALLRIMQQRSWYHVSALLDVGASTDIYAILAKFLLEDARTTPNFDIALINFDSRNQWTFEMALGSAKSRSRVMVVFAHTRVLLDLLAEAEKLDMANGDYVYFVIQPSQSSIYGSSALFSNPANAQEVSRFKSVIYVTTAPTRRNLTDLNLEMAVRAARFYDTTYENGTQPLDSYSVRATYDAVEMWATVMNETFASDELYSSLCDGAQMARQFLNRTFDLETGLVFVDGEGIHLLDLDIYAFDSETGKMVLLVNYDSATSRLIFLPQFADNPLTNPPRDVPVCGFSYTRGICSRSNNIGNIVLLSVLVPVILILSIFVWATLTYLRRNSGKHAVWWEISDSRLVQNVTSGTAPNSYLDDTAVWCGPIVPTTKTAVNLLKSSRIMKQMERLHHENVNRLIGISFGGNEACFISEYCKRGALTDLLREVQLDWDLKESLLIDLSEALCYIHQSPLRMHGDLSVRNCLISARFSLKVTRLGFREIMYILGATHRPRKETLEVSNQDSDVIAFGRIAEVIITQGEEPGAKNRFSMSPQLFALLHLCAETNSEHRPTMHQVQSILHGSLKSRSGTMMGRLMNRLTNYAKKLEEAVQDKTDELIMQKKACDALLHEMLPSAVVQKLRLGVKVEAELFETATICFIGIDGFMPWVSTQPPRAVVSLLNRVHSFFDGQLPQFDVQKVESISDSYMVISGVSTPNYQRHSTEICKMALHLMEKSDRLGLMDRMTLCVGIHSGACAAGVIGTKIPRYCIFGDTVNVASRMQSSGQGNKIQISSVTANLVSGKENFVCVPRGTIHVKGKGELPTFWLETAETSFSS